MKAPHHAQQPEMSRDIFNPEDRRRVHGRVETETFGRGGSSRIMGVLSDPHKLPIAHMRTIRLPPWQHMRQSDQTHVYEVPLGVPLMLRFGWGDLFPGLHTYEVHTVPRVAQGESLQNLKHGVPVRTVTKKGGRKGWVTKWGRLPRMRIPNCIVIRQQGKNPQKLL